MKGRANTIELDGRTFGKLCSGSTVQHDLWLMQRATESGLATARKWSGETDDAFAARMMEMAIKSGLILEMLGGLLLPEGKGPEDWTPDMALSTATFLGAITEPHEKSKVNGLILSLLIDFFSVGLSSSESSQRSSAQAKPEKDAAAGTDTANGAPSSVH